MQNRKRKEGGRHAVLLNLVWYTFESIYTKLQNPNLCSYCILERLNSYLHCVFKFYHLVSTIYILTFYKSQNIYHRYQMVNFERTEFDQ